MITSLQLVDFKNFAEEKLQVGPFTVVVGTNASGQEQYSRRFPHPPRDRSRLHLGGDYRWKVRCRGPARMGHRSAAVLRKSFALDNLRSVFRVEMQGISLWEREGIRSRYRRNGRYSITVSRDDTKPGVFRVVREELKVGWGTIYTSHPGLFDPVNSQDDDTHLLLRMEKTGEQRKFGHRIAVRPDQPALTQIGEHRRVVRTHKDYASVVADILANMRFLDLEPNRMRQPAFPGQNILGDGGENLPTVLREICTDSSRREILAEWTRELTPMDVRDFEVPDRSDRGPSPARLPREQQSNRVGVCRLGRHAALSGHAGCPSR